MRMESKMKVADRIDLRPDFRKSVSYVIST